jgi:hypothetical protein
MQPNLARNTTPTATSVTRPFALPRAAAYGLVFSLTVGPTASYNDLYKRITLLPIFICGPDTTGSALRIEPASTVTPAANWLEAVIDEIHAQISDDAWAKVPPIRATDIDKQVYKT